MADPPATAREEARRAKETPMERYGRQYRELEADLAAALAREDDERTAHEATATRLAESLARIVKLRAGLARSRGKVHAALAREAETQRLIGWARFNNGKGKQSAVETLLGKAYAVLALASAVVPATEEKHDFAAESFRETKNPETAEMLDAAARVLIGPPVPAATEPEETT